MHFTKILCPTDFSPGSRQAVQVATRIASESNAELVLVHSWHIPPLAYSEFTYPAELMQELASVAKGSLDDAVRESAALGAKNVRGKLGAGVPWTEIVSVLEHGAYDLCVMATHGRTGISRVLVGSVAEKVIRYSPCPVLAVRPDTQAKPFRRVLVPTDFSDDAEQALDLAADVVVPDGVINLLHVVELPIANTGGVPDVDWARDLDMRAVVALERSAERVRGQGKAHVETVERIGYPGAEILRALDDDPRIDLVVMGTHGRTGIKRALMGSVAEKIVRHARCPVLVARKRA